ncbi:MAG: O-antigen ligase family protein [Flavobacterium sp.]
MIDKLNQYNLDVFAILLLLLSIPLNYGISNATLIFLILTSLFISKKITINIGLMLPIFLYVLMLFSYFWSIDKSVTIQSLLKEVSLFLVPISFFLFGKIEENQFKKIVLYYAYGIAIYSLVFLLIAFYKYLNTNDIAVFYYHELVTKDVNAIHFSIFVSISIFILLLYGKKNLYNYILMSFLGIFLLLLSSKTVIFSFVVLLLFYEIFYSKIAQRLRLRNIIIFGILIISMLFIGKVKERFMSEFQANTTKSISHNVIDKNPSTVNIISMKEAWNNHTFSPNDYFPGSAFRVYQSRVFFELMQENKVYLTGFGLGASQEKIKVKTLNYNLFSGNEFQEGYQNKNFHNQYFQIFSEIGIFGFLILIVMIGYSIQKSLKYKNFIFFAFISLMMIVFFTESFLWRQRGILFFITLYCVFHQLNLEKKTIINNN